MTNLRPGPSSELLRTFLAVASHLNTTLAAKTLHRTQSSVSIQIRKLEDELGVQLFERRPRGMELTEAGRSLLPSASSAIKAIDAIGELFGEPLAGKLRLGIPDDYSQVVLQRTLVEFSQRNPHVEVHVTTGCSGAYPEMIKANELDLALHSAAPGHLEPSFFCEPMVWAGHRDLHRVPGTPVPLALFDRSCWWRNIPTNVLNEASIAWRAVVSTESHDGVRAAIMARTAIGILPRSGLPRDAIALADLPPLPPSSLVLLRASAAAPDLTDAMVESLTSAFASIATN